MDERYSANRSKRNSRIWYVTDSLGRFPSWRFNGPREELNRVHAATAAKLLKRGYGYP